MALVDWKPGIAAFWVCRTCHQRSLRGTKILEGSYDGRIMMPPAYLSGREL
jgi:hypothetical protein